MLVPREAIDAMVAHARFAAPEEACGLLAVDGHAAISMVYCLSNSERSAFSFTVAPDEHFGALRHAERQGWKLGGAFHSHPRSEAVPSRSDIEGALDPGWVHFIVGLGGDRPEVRAWSIRDGAAAEVAFETVGGVS